MAASLEGKRIEANGLSFHVVDEGGGEDAVVLLHGFPDSSYLWRKQLPALLDGGFRVIAPDLRGYGRSDKPEGVESYQMRLLVQDVNAAKTLLKFSAFQRPRTVGIVLDNRRLKHLLEGNRHPLGDSSDVLHDRHVWIIPVVSFRSGSES